MKRRLEHMELRVEDAAPIVEEHRLCFALRQLPVVDALARAFYSETYGNDYCRHYDEREYDSRDVGVYTAVYLLCTTRTLAAALAFGDENVSATVRVLRRLIDGARIGRYTYNAYDTSRTCEWIVRRAWHMDLFDYHETLTTGRRWSAPPIPRPIENTWQLSAVCLNVRTLKIDRERNLTSIDTLCHLPHLEKLHIESCHRLERADGLAACPKLRILRLDGCTGLDLSGLQSAPPLENFTMIYCSDVQFLRTCRTLRTVFLCSRSETLQDLRPLAASAQTLRTFKLYSCPNLRNLDGLEQCSELRHVTISQCEKLNDVTAIGGMTRLETLNLYHCNAIQDAAAVGRCIMLRTLHISSDSMKEMPVLGACTRLHKVNVTFCRRLRSLNGVYACPALRTMTASACGSLVDISAIASCEALEKLDLSGGCCSLRDITAVGACAALRTLDLGCRALTDVSALERCTSLRTLSLYGCNSLRGVRLGSVTRDRPLQWLRHQRALYDQRRARTASK